jgi:gamma-glutamyltranspeptidase/glutathione hydrolase
MRIRKLLIALLLIVCIAVLGLLSAGLYLRHEYARKTQWPAAAVRGPQAMVVSDEEMADEAGIAILKEGGNAVDAAAAVGFALAVVEPAAGNIGGGGFMLVRLADGKTGFVDYREEAPQKSSRNMYQLPDGTFDPEGSTVGYRAVGVPGTIAGLALAVRTYGKLPLAKIMEPAIRLADAGFPVSQKLARSLEANKDTLTRFPVSKRIFLNDGGGFRAGEVLRQPELAATLRRIAANGPDEFYKGDTAHHLADDMAKNGGLITLDDLRNYKAFERTPTTGAYKGYTIIGAPPPSSGGVGIQQMLGMLEGSGYEKHGAGSAGVGRIREGDARGRRRPEIAHPCRSRCLHARRRRSSK